MISKNQIKYIQSLHLKKNRDSQGLFIVEGVKSVSEFIQDDSVVIKEVFAVVTYLQQHAAFLEKKQIPFTEVSEEDLKKISLQTSPNQVLAVAHQNRHELNEALLASGTTLFLDDIRDPGNLGTIIRIADWFGIKQIICSENTTELYNPKTLQASMGAALRVKVIYMDFQKLRPSIGQIPVYGAVLTGENIYTSTLQKGLIIIGNEANGISNEVLQLLTHPITIPAAQHNGSESLNAANACAIICAEFHRQLTYQ